MKKIIILLIPFVLVSVINISSFAQKGKNTKWYKKGAQMVYSVNGAYDFTVTIKNLKKGIDFDFTMKNGDIKGNIKITPEAMNSATRMDNYFRSGDYVFKDKTTVWVSKAIYKSLKKNENISIQPSNVTEILKLVGSEQLKVKIDGQETEITVLHAKTDRGSDFWIWDNPNAPIIMHMIIDFEVNISEIKSK